jgi:hypothetical protein
MSASARRLLWLLIAAGVTARLVVAFTTLGQPYDVRSFEIVRHLLPDTGLDVYGRVNPPGGEIYFWPYLPGFFPWILAADGLADLIGLRYRDLIQLPPILADVGIAWLVQWFLGRRGAGERIRLAAAALVLLGPSFAVISGYHTQIDSLAILPAVAALVVWCERPHDRRRWLFAGALIGLGAALKTTPALVLIALLPSARSLREGLSLIGVAALVPALLVAPFAAADPDGVRHMLDYRGAPGMGGLTLLLNPGLSEFWLTEIWRPERAPLDPNAVVDLLSDNSSLVNGALFIAVAAFLLRYRASAPVGASLAWTALYVFGTGFFFQYLIWGLPFLLLAGYVRETALLQAAFLVPTVLFYWGPRDDQLATVVYVVIMLAIWLALVVALLALGRRVVRGRPLARPPAPTTAGGS